MTFKNNNIMKSNMSKMNRFELPTDNNHFDIFFERVIELFEEDIYKNNLKYLNSTEFIVYVNMLYDKSYTPEMVVKETMTFL